MNNLEKISKNIVDKFECNNGAKANLDTGYYSQKYCEIKEISVWKFGNLLANARYCAAIEVLDRLQFLLKNTAFSSEEIVEVMSLTREELFKRAEETDRESRY